MRRLQFVLLLSLVVMLSACCCSRSGKGGAGGADGLDDGNIPLASAGSELSDVHFAFDSSALSGEAQAILSKNAKWILGHESAKVVAEGHCDERGTNEYNLALGERRARAVYDYLRSSGVSAEQMSTISYGEELPLDPRSNEEAWRKNRRAHFAIK